MIFNSLGFSDCTRCFSCGIGLRNWEDGDIPWIEHARWCPTCDFLQQRKGDLFIQMHRQDNNHEEQYSPEPPRSSGHFVSFQIKFCEILYYFYSITSEECIKDCPRDGLNIKKTDI